MRTIEGAKRHAVAGCAACAAGLALLLVLAYWLPPFERLDEEILNALSTTSVYVVHDLAFAVEQLVDPIGWVVAATAAFLLATRQGRRQDAFTAVALVAGTAIFVLLLKEVFEHSRPLSVPVGEFEWSPIAKAFPSGNSAGALAISLAFLYVVPPPWRRPTAAAGVVFTLAVAAGLLVLNYHYPSDILGGWLVALGWCFGLEALRQRREGGG